MLYVTNENVWEDVADSKTNHDHKEPSIARCEDFRSSFFLFRSVLNRQLLRRYHINVRNSVDWRLVRDDEVLNVTFRASRLSLIRRVCVHALQRHAAQKARKIIGGCLLHAFRRSATVPRETFEASFLLVLHQLFSLFDLLERLVEFATSHRPSPLNLIVRPFRNRIVRVDIVGSVLIAHLIALRPAGFFLLPQTDSRNVLIGVGVVVIAVCCSSLFRSRQMTRAVLIA